jgi:serine/threonine-protein kinase
MSAAAREALDDHLAGLQAECAGAPLRRIEQAVGVASVDVGEYRLLERLGGGGMGVVYKAQHRRLARLVAVKFPRFAGELDHQCAARFVREARLLGRLEHKHLVPALDAGESPYGPYLVTAFVEGETLETLVKREGPLSVELAMELTAQAACGLAYAHSHGVVHRDVKPSNLLLGDDGELRVLDFGLAKLLAEDVDNDGSMAASRTQTGAFLGTVGYAAPEQLVDGGNVDARADVYALGGVIYFLLTGEPLHEGRLVDRLKRPTKRLPSLAGRRPEVSPSLEKLWRRMVAAAPENRLASMADVEATVRQESISASRPAAFVNRRWCKTAFEALAVVAAVIAAWIAWPAQRRVESPPPMNDSVPLRSVGARDPERIVNSIDMPLVLIPAGAVSKPFYLGETEVTCGQFRRFVDDTGYVTDAEAASGWGLANGAWVQRAGYSWKNVGEAPTGDNYPVNNVTLNYAVAICRWLTASDRAGNYR